MARGWGHHRPLRRLTSRAGGVVLFLVMAILVVMTLLGLALNSMVGGAGNQTSAYSSLALMNHAAFEVAGVVFTSLDSTLRNPQDPNFQTILDGGDQATLRATWPTTFTVAEAKELEVSVDAVEVRFEKTKDLAAGTGWHDPREKLLRLVLTIDVSSGKSSFHRFRRRYRFVRLGKVVRLGLPVVSKFTLFLRNPEPTDETNRGYNCLDTFIDGELGHTSAVSPLCLIHAPAASRDDLPAAGWVFLGGDKDLQLHVTSGNHATYGELFQFHSLENPQRSPPVFDFTDLPGTPVFRNGVMFLDSAIKASVSIRGSYFGFYKWDRRLGSDMNEQGILQRFFSSAQSRTMSSSFLHLTGTYTDPSPTIVIGKVKRVFAYYSGLLYQASGEGASDKFLDLLEAPAAEIEDGGQAVGFWKTVNLKRSFPGQRFSRDTLELSAQEVTAEKLFSTPETYLKFASSLVIEPFNRVYDYLYNDSGTLPPPEKFTTATKLPVEMAGDNVRLADRQSGTTLFQGDLRRLTSRDLLLDRIGLVVPDAASFARRFLRDGALDLQRRVIMVRGDLELPANLSVTSPGILVVEGTLRLLGGIRRCPDGPLTLVSLGGDIAIGAVNEEVWAHLVAFAGTVHPTNNSPVKLMGALAADRLNPVTGTGWQKGWPGGGTVTYDERLDPTRPDRQNTYAVQLADVDDDFQVDKEP